MVRTYIAARVWRDYPSDIAVEPLQHLGDRDLALFLEGQAAKWIRETISKSESDGTEVPVVGWARTVPEPDAAILALVPKAVQERLGMTWLTHMIVTGKYPEAPMWALVHAAPSPADATAIVETTAIRIPHGPLVEVQIIEQTDAQTTAQWLGWERTLEEFERRHRNPFDLEEWDRWPSHPLKRFRDEVERVARVLALHRPVTAVQEAKHATPDGQRSGAAEAIATSIEAGREHNQLIRHAGAWEIEFEGTRASLPDLVGMHMLKRLLQRPNEPISVEELLGEQPCPADASTDEPQLDPAAFRSVRKRLEELESELVEAEEDNDIARRESLAAEKHDLIQQIATARSTAGRSRQITGGARARARGKVASGLATALSKISEAHAGCGRHLRDSIVSPTGSSPCYRPRRETPWLLGG